MTVTAVNPLQEIRRGLNDLVQSQLDRLAAESALAPNSLRYELNISIDRRAMSEGSEGLKQIARTLLLATGGDPTNMEMAVLTASNKIKRNVVSQRTIVEIERDAAMLPDLIGFHRAAERWLTELDSTEGEEVA